MRGHFPCEPSTRYVLTQPAWSHGCPVSPFPQRRPRRWHGWRTRAVERAAARVPLLGTRRRMESGMSTAVIVAVVVGLPVVLAGLLVLNRWEAMRDRRLARNGSRRRGRR